MHLARSSPRTIIDGSRLKNIAIYRTVSCPSLLLSRREGSIAQNLRWPDYGRTGPISRRLFFTESLPAALVPPAIFTSLLLGLWTYKCLMTIIFQDKIIYMPYMPPFARREKLKDYASLCRPVEWEQRMIRSLDGTKLAICVGRQASDRLASTGISKEIFICYFQGNGSSSPPRLPLLSNVLKVIEAKEMIDGSATRYTMIALSYRGFWKSSGRASQSGIEKDAQALLGYVASISKACSHTELILWGQSIGAGVATTAAATYLTSHATTTNISLKSLILETPFTGIKSMLLALYPQKWLPYRYLWPFLWNHWDSLKALRKLSLVEKPSRPSILIVAATRDEVVPAGEADRLEILAKELGIDVMRRDVVGALHTDATIRKEGQEIVGNFVYDASRTESVPASAVPCRLPTN